MDNEAKMTERRGLPVDFLLEAATTPNPGNGEDAYVYALSKGASMAGVFDGCGGTGARRYKNAGGRTGAYLASRVVSGATRDWFELGEALADNASEAAARLEVRARDYLRMSRAALCEQSAMLGTISKELPTTCAVVIAQGDAVEAELRSFSAGDSRCYLLDEDGLHQLTADDLRGYDAMENLHADARLTNVINASERFEIRVKVVPISRPCVAFAATDGCFGYLPTPMAFEHLLLSTLSEAASPNDWEARLRAAFAALAGDDATLCGLSLGFGGFARLKATLALRLAHVTERYVEGWAERSLEDQRALWDEYKSSYYSV